MPWMPYGRWAGTVIRRRIRVPHNVLSIRVFGASQNPLPLRSGAMGTIENILPERAAAAPSYVKFPRVPDLTHAAEVRVVRSENPAVVWKDLWSVQMESEQTLVVIRRAELDRMEIEYERS